MTKLLEIRVRGLRTLDDVSLELGGSTVLIGDNGTGKSTLLEALRVLSLIPDAQFLDELNRVHGIAGAIRPGQSLQLDVRVGCDDGQYAYSLGLGDGQSIATELLARLPAKMTLQEWSSTPANQHEVLFSRARATVLEAKDDAWKNSTGTFTFLTWMNGPRAPEPFGSISAALISIEVHLPFDTTAAWARRQYAGKSPMREPQVAEPTSMLALFGANLANAYQALKNDFGRDHWEETLSLLQLGLGSHVTDVSVSTFPGGGYFGLSLQITKSLRIPALQLSDGQLSYMAFVAMFRLDQGRSLLAFDEPETHLHPALLTRVLTMFESAAERYPVVLCTHSDRLLDALSDPVAAVRVCELDEQHRTRLRRLDAQQYETWRGDYLGVGHIRAESQLGSIVAESPEP